MRQSHTAVIERNVEWTASFTTEPYETAWATEAIFFVRILHVGSLSSLRFHCTSKSLPMASTGATKEQNSPSIQPPNFPGTGFRILAVGYA